MSKINYPKGKLTKIEKKELLNKIRERMRKDIEDGKTDLYTYDMDIIMKNKK